MQSTIVIASQVQLLKLLLVTVVEALPQWLYPLIYKIDSPVLQPVLAKPLNVILEPVTPKMYKFSQASILVNCTLSKVMLSC